MSLKKVSSGEIIEFKGNKKGIIINIKNYKIGGINMKTITLNNTNLSIPEIGMGCMRIVELENVDAVKGWVDTALEHGINFFDHADIYGKGRIIWTGTDTIVERKNNPSVKMFYPTGDSI